MKTKSDIKHLQKCKSSIIYPKSFRWEYVNNRKKRTNSINDLKDRNNDLRSSARKHYEIKIQLHESLTWMKYHNLIYLIN